MLRRTALLSTALCSVLLVAACKSSKNADNTTSAPPALVNGGSVSASATTPSSPPTPSSAAASSTPPAPASSLPPAPSGSGVPTAYDPCQLVTAAEASALAGTTFGNGAESTTQGGAKVCTYGGQTTNVFMVIVAQAPDATTANSDFAQEEARAQAAMVSQIPAGVTAPQLGDIAGVGDRAAAASGSVTVQGHPISISAIYILKGATFLTYSDLVLDKPAPTIAALVGQATVSLGRIS
jgi:hypothetical protein